MTDRLIKEMWRVAHDVGDDGTALVPGHMLKSLLHRIEKGDDAVVQQKRWVAHLSKMMPMPQHDEHG